MPLSHEDIEISSYIQNKKLRGNYRLGQTEDDFENEAKKIIADKGIAALEKLNLSNST